MGVALFGCFFQLLQKVVVFFVGFLLVALVWQCNMYFFEGCMCFSGCEGGLMVPSFRESRLKKGDRQPPTNPNKNKIHTYHIMPLGL